MQRKRPKLGGIFMIKPFDLFTVTGNDEPLWLSCAESLTEAIDAMRRRGPGRYLVISQTTGHKQSYEVRPEGITVIPERTA